MRPGFWHPPACFPPDNALDAMSPFDLNSPPLLRWREPFVILMLLFFFPLVWVMIAVSGASEEKARNAFRVELRNFDYRDVLLIDGRQSGHTAELIADLKRATADRGSHTRISSHPAWHRVELKRDDRAMTVSVVRDEGPEDKYWIFLPDKNGARIGSFVDPRLSAWLNESGPPVHPQ